MLIEEDNNGDVRYYKWNLYGANRIKFIEHKHLKKLKHDYKSSLQLEGVEKIILCDPENLIVETANVKGVGYRLYYVKF